ncbi:MAG: hypothetical protein GY817_04500, partial [bacterium]|nr:hypothetical protein [bacterium]
TGANVATVVNALIDEQESNLISSTLAEAVADTTLVVGMSRRISDRAGATFKVITKGSVDHVDKPNTFSIVECTGVNTLALSLEYDNTLFVKRFGAKGDRSANDTQAMLYVMSRLADYSTLRFDGAVCNIDDNLYIENIKGLSILGDGGGLYKAGGSTLFTNPMMQFSGCDDLSINGVLIEGSFAGSAIDAGDYGLRVLSGERVEISGNTFKNLGDSAWTVASASGGTAGKTQSKDVTVTGNIFDNVWQVSTTGNSGGVIGYTFSSNICNMKGAVKFASRSDNAKNLIISDNVIVSETSAGIELVGYVDVLITNNTIDGKTYGINAYVNTLSEAATSPLENIKVESNIITSETKPCVRVNTQLSALDPYNYTGFSIKNNTLTRTDELDTATAIAFVGDGFDGVVIEGNNIKGGITYFYDRAPNNLITFDKGVTVRGNTARHASADSTPFIYGAGTEIPHLSIIDNDVVSTGGLLYLNTNVAVLNDNLVITGNTVQSEAGVIDAGFGNSHIIKGNRLTSTTTSVELLKSSATNVYLSDNIFETARTGRAARLDYAAMTFDGGGNVLPSTATVSYYG